MYDIKTTYHPSTGKIKEQVYYLRDTTTMHREDSPAYIMHNRHGIPIIIIYMLNGLVHRENGPAYITYNDDGSLLHEKYFINNMLHRTDGPAVIRNDNFLYPSDYFINGVHLCEDKFNWFIEHDVYPSLSDYINSLPLDIQTEFLLKFKGN